MNSKTEDEDGKVTKLKTCTFFLSCWLFAGEKLGIVWDCVGLSGGGSQRFDGNGYALFSFYEECRKPTFALWARSGTVV